MKNKIIALVVGLLLALGASFALPATPASAHNYDNYSYIYCTAHKSDPGGHVWVNHSWPYSLSPGYLTYRCTQYDTTAFGHPEYEYYVVRNMDTGHHYRQGGYFWCGAYYCAHH